MTAAVVAATGASYIAGANRSLSFASASSQQLSMGDSGFGAYDTDKFSITFWLKATTNGGTIMAHGSTSNPAVSAFELGINGTRMEFAYFNGSNTGYFTSTTSGWTGDWNHVVVHADLANATSSDRIKMWVNGAAETAYGYSAPYTSCNNSGQIVTIGGKSSTYLNGKLYQLAFFSDTLVSASEIYNGGTPLDIRGYSGLYSYIHTNDPNITDDYVLATDWTNTNSVTLSTDIPT